MAREHTEKIKCPKCGAEHDVVIWDSINTRQQPLLKEKARTGSMFLYTCPECGETFQLNYPFLYNEVESRSMFFYVISEESYQEAVKAFDESAKILPDIERRIVRNRNEFLEKLNILDAKLDDRIIELQKMFLGAYIQQENPDFVFDHMYFFMDPAGEICFILMKDGKEHASFDFEQELYDSLAENFAEVLKEKAPYLVDAQWALTLMEKEQG